MTIHREPIASRQNTFFKELHRLLGGRGVKKSQKTLVSGEKLIRELVRDIPHQAVSWTTGGQDMPDPPIPIQHHRFVPELFRELDVFGTHAPLLEVRTPQIPVWLPESGLLKGMNVLIPFQDPENVGAVMRSAVAFEVDRVILLENSAHPFHPKAIRASGGAVFQAQLLQGPRLEDLPADLPLTPLSPDGGDITQHEFTETCGLLPGLEGPGLPAAWRSRALSIPIAGTVESLNAATGVAIALYIWSRNRKP